MKTLIVKSDTHEYEVVVNGVSCECGFMEHADLIHYVGDTAWCDACFTHFTE